MSRHNEIPSDLVSDVSAAIAPAAQPSTGATSRPISTGSTLMKRQKAISVHEEPLVDLSMICADDTCREFIEPDDLLGCIAPGCGQNVSSLSFSL